MVSGTSPIMLRTTKKPNVAATVWAKIHEPKWVSVVSSTSHLVIAVLGLLSVSVFPQTAQTTLAVNLTNAGAVLFVLGGGVLGIFPALAGMAYFERFGIIFSTLGFGLWSVALVEPNTIPDVSTRFCLYLICVSFLVTRLFRLWGEHANLAGPVVPFWEPQKENKK